MIVKLLVCGTRKKNCRDRVFAELDSYRPDLIIEGCCPDSADAYAEEWAEKNHVPIEHHPSTPGNYLKRNVEMVGKADIVIAFWDGFSYGTAHTIAQAVLQGKEEVRVIKV